MNYELNSVGRDNFAGWLVKSTGRMNYKLPSGEWLVRSTGRMNYEITSVRWEVRSTGENELLGHTGQYTELGLKKIIFDVLYLRLSDNSYHYWILIYV